MNLNPTDRCLSLVLSTLDTAIAPELQSATARGALDLIRATLLDLQKRQGPAAVLLRACVLDGETLEREALRQLDPASATPAATPLPDGFDALRERHAALTSRLDRLCKRLAAGGNADGAALLRRAAEWELSYYRQLQTLQPDALALATPSAPPLSREFMQDFLNSRRAPEQGALEVTEFAPVLGGFGKQTFFCTTRDAQGHSEELVVRKSDPMPIMLHGVFRIEQEFDLLAALATTDFPVPQPIALGHQLPGVDGSFYTMNRLPGRVAGSFLDAHRQTYPESLLLRLAELLAQLHRIPLETFGAYFARHEEAAALQETIEQRYRRNLRGWRQYVQTVEHLDSPFVTWLFDWLDRHVPADTRRPVLTHGDFNVHNVLADGERVTAVLDWECADFGAPEQDLAYIQPHIARHMDWQRFVDHYHASGGVAIDPQRLPFCLAYSVLRTILGGNRGTANLQSGRNGDLRYVMVELGFAPAFMQMALHTAR